jgi:periplasmic protein TonB
MTGETEHYAFSPHVSRSRIRAYIFRELSEKENKQFEQHIMYCSFCAETMKDELNEMGIPAASAGLTVLAKPLGIPVQHSKTKFGKKKEVPSVNKQPIQKEEKKPVAPADTAPDKHKQEPKKRVESNKNAQEKPGVTATQVSMPDTKKKHKKITGFAATITVLALTGIGLFQAKPLMDVFKSDKQTPNTEQSSGLPAAGKPMEAKTSTFADKVNQQQEEERVLEANVNAESQSEETTAEIPQENQNNDAQVAVTEEVRPEEVRPETQELTGSNATEETAVSPNNSTEQTEPAEETNSTTTQPVEQISGGSASTNPVTPEEITTQPGALEENIASEKENSTETTSKAQPKDGNQAYQQYINSNVVVPNKARRNNVTGNVVVSFFVNESGSLSNINVINGLGYGCDEEAIRVVKNGPAWEPAKENGQVKGTVATLSVPFN